MLLNDQTQPADHSALIQQLRDDARAVKDCFTNFSFQSIAFSAIVIGAMAAYQPTYPLTALAAVVIIALLLAVARIGTYKYSTANRIFGYELHLDRTKTIPDYPTNRFADLRNLGWEEAIGAWRIVQATIFDHLYYTEPLWPNKLRRRHRGQKIVWFQPKSLIEKKAKYYAGSYLETMLRFLYILILLATMPMAIMIVQLERQNLLTDQWHAALWIAWALFLFFIGHRIYKIDIRRRVLEDGLLSIHSCAIMWLLVMLAHHRAVEKTKEQSSEKIFNFEEYTHHLSQEAISLKNKIFEIEDWIASRL